MNKTILTGVIAAVFLMILGTGAQAGLINYDRVNKKGGTPAKTKADAAMENGKANRPEWSRKQFRVSNNIEARYDVNRDDTLQTSEIKIFLRDVLDEVDRKGKYSAQNSPILRSYDRNNDRMISREEADGIIRDVR